jgi:UDP-2,3-diacylglucosamine hydrolase
MAASELLTWLMPVTIVTGMRDLFIADAHLRRPEDKNYRALLSFLENQPKQLRTLYLLGDIFEFWVGFNHVVFTNHIPLLNCLRSLHENGTKIVYVEGNHDFNLGPFFEQTLDCTILPDGGMIEIDGHRVYLAHGDLADPSDRGYRILRSIFRSRFARFLSRTIHPDTIWKFAAWASRNSSGKKTGRNSDECRPILLDYADRLFKEGAETVLTGHYHTPFTHQTETGTLIALGDWIEQFSYAVFEQGEFKLKTFKPSD